MGVNRIYPIAGKVQGNERVHVLLSCADITAPKLATEVNATTSLAVEAFFREFWPTATQETGQAPRRILTTSQLQSLGNTNWEVPVLNYIWRPNQALTVDANKAYATLVKSLEVWVLRRSGVSKDIDYAAGDFVDVFHVRLGSQIPMTSGDSSDAYAEYQTQQAVELLEEPQIHKALAA